jgi:hypothetical protein
LKVFSEHLTIKRFVAAFFVFVQTMVTICMCAALVELVIMFYIWIVSGCCQRESKGQQKKRDNLKLLQTAAGITVFNGN